MTIKKFSWIVFAITTAVCLYAITTFPADLSVPVHWGVNGEPDRFGSVLEAMLFPPAVMLGILLLFQFLPFLEPRKENLEESSAAKDWIAFCVVALMAVIAFANISYGYGTHLPMMRIITGGITMMLIIMGNFISKTRSNFFIGIRTPWTLSSDEVWRKTHRLAGRLFMLAGAVGFSLNVFIAQTDISKLIVSLVLPAALIPVIYSWYIWRKLESSKGSE